MVENIYFTSFLAPTPPQMFQITSVMTTSLSFSWQVPMTLNGNLTGYQLFCQPLLSGIPSSQMLTPGPTAVMAILSGLYPGVEYNCSIVARNGAGPSEAVYINGTTPETGMYMYMHVPYSVLLCFKLHGLQPVNWGHQRVHPLVCCATLKLIVCCDQMFTIMCATYLGRATFSSSSTEI